MTGDERAAHPLSVRVQRGSPSDEDVAAMIAVVTEAYASEVESAEAVADRRASVWGRGMHAMRVVPQPGSVWGRFEG